MSYHSRLCSRMATPPIPPAAQMERSAYRFPSTPKSITLANRSISTNCAHSPVLRNWFVAEMTRRPPVAANGCPIATDPPHGLILSAGMVPTALSRPRTTINQCKRLYHHMIPHCGRTFFRELVRSECPQSREYLNNMAVTARSRLTETYRPGQQMLREFRIYRCPSKTSLNRRKSSGHLKPRRTKHLSTYLRVEGLWEEQLLVQ